MLSVIRLLSRIAELVLGWPMRLVRALTVGVAFHPRLRPLRYMALFGVGSGPIRGFAVTLFIGIVTTMFTAFTLTKLIVAIWVKLRRPKEVPL